jgi:hypothetical protein
MRRRYKREPDTIEKNWRRPRRRLGVTRVLELSEVTLLCAGGWKGARHTHLDSSPNPYPIYSKEHRSYALGYARGATGAASPGKRMIPGEQRMLYRFEVKLLRLDLRQALEDPQ